MNAARSRQVGWLFVAAVTLIVLVITAGIVWFAQPAKPHRDGQHARRPFAYSAKDVRLTNRGAVDLWARPDDECVAEGELAAAREQGREPDLTYARSGLYYRSLPARIHVQIVGYVRATCVDPQHTVMLAQVQVTDATSDADGEVGYVTEAVLSR